MSLMEQYLDAVARQDIDAQYELSLQIARENAEALNAEAAAEAERKRNRSQRSAKQQIADAVIAHNRRNS